VGYHPWMLNDPLDAVGFRIEPLIYS